MSIEHIKISKKAKDQLIWLKRKTGIFQWNILSRWAFCISLSEPRVPPPAKIPADSSVEMSWKVFAGQYQDIYLALLKERCRKDKLGTSDEVLSDQFKLHLHRGIGYLFSDKKIRRISNLIGKAIV